MQGESTGGPASQSEFFIVSQLSQYVSFVSQVSSSYEPRQSSFNWQIKLVIPVLAYQFDWLWGTRVGEVVNHEVFARKGGCRTCML